MKKLISVLCIILVLSMLFCGCTRKTRADITDDLMPNGTDTPATDSPLSTNVPATDRPQGTDAPGKNNDGNDNNADILPNTDGKTDGTDKDSGVDNNVTAEPTASPDVSPALSPAVSPIG